MSTSHCCIHTALYECHACYCHIYPAKSHLTVATSFFRNVFPVQDFSMLPVLLQTAAIHKNTKLPIDLLEAKHKQKSPATSALLPPYLQSKIVELLWVMFSLDCIQYHLILTGTQFRKILQHSASCTQNDSASSIPNQKFYDRINQTLKVGLKFYHLPFPYFFSTFYSRTMKNIHKPFKKLLSPPNIPDQTFHKAKFWEQRQLRKQFLKYILFLFFYFSFLC